MKYFDIAPNLGDPRFRGIVRGKQLYDDDLSEVLSRALDNGVQYLMITIGSIGEIEDVKSVLECAKHHSSLTIVVTLGIHPTRSKEWNETTKQIIIDMIKERDLPVNAIGECGLDAERTHFATLEEQIPVFEAQLELALDLNLPLFLHNRKTTNQFLASLKKVAESRGVAISTFKGVVHSFTDTAEEAKRILTETELDIGINGASLREEWQLNELIPAIPLDRLHLETDSPWCDIRRTHASYVHVKTKFEDITVKKEKLKERSNMLQGRQEPAHIVQVAEVVHAMHAKDALKDALNFEEMADLIFANSYKLFIK